MRPANAQKKGGLAGQYDTDDTNRDVEIVLQVKNSIPSYTLRGYTLKYRDGDGREYSLALPDMQPSESYMFVLKNINAQYAFEVHRPGGYSVIAY